MQISFLDQIDGKTSFVGADLSKVGKSIDGKSYATNGVVVEVDRSLSLYGSTQDIFNLTRSIPVNKFTRLRYNVTMVNVEISAICLFENFPDAFSSDHSPCHMADSSQDGDVSIGKILHGKQAEIKFIGFVQDSILDGTSQFSNIDIVQGENTAIYDQNGCKDPYAITSGSGDATLCFCADGYMASNGGKKQGDFDTCVRCIDSDLCQFDGELCSSNDDCIASECSMTFEPRCLSRVSTRMMTEFF